MGRVRGWDGRLGVGRGWEETLGVGEEGEEALVRRVEHACVDVRGSVDGVSDVGGVFGVSGGLAGGSAAVPSVEEKCASGVVCCFVCLE